MYVRKYKRTSRKRGSIVTFTMLILLGIYFYLTQTGPLIQLPFACIQLYIHLSLVFWLSLDRVKSTCTIFLHIISSLIVI